ncbi:MAG: hypothetical protein ACOYO1_03145 [Bacteroidales bacterium]
MKKNIVFLAVVFLILLLVSKSVFCQSPTNLDKDVLYRKEKAFYFVLHNEGWGIGYRKGNHLAFNKTRMFEGEIVGMSHPKETKSENPYFGDAHGYVYGQLNSFYVIRGGVGYKKMLNDKPYWGGVQLSYIYFGGASLGLARPKYLYIINIDNSNPFGYELTLERYNPDKHFEENIYGGGPLLKGFESIKPYPGLYGKFGFNFEFGEYDEKIRAIEVGGIIDYYFASIPMMAFNKYPNYFLTLYINIQFGKRYNLY